MKQLVGRIHVSLQPTHDELRLNYRRARYGRRMTLMGVRPESVRRYLSRGFPNGWTRALRREMTRLVWDIKYRRRTA